MRRIVLLGASNLTLGLSEIAEIAGRGFDRGPVRLLAAAGHGRGYARPSLVLGRRLPPIAHCGLWDALGREAGLPTRAVLADAGNDLAFGAAVDETLEAVAGCLEGLAAAGADTVVVLPPVAGIERLSRARFVVLRSILFPGRTFDQASIVRRMRRLAAELTRLAQTTGARTAETEAEWLGGDGIHIRWRRRREAWEALLAGWRPSAETAAVPLRPRWSWRRAHRAGFLAFPRRRDQPSRSFPDGSTLSCY